MSALGQKQTYAAQNLTSALHPIATAKADIRKTPCLLYPWKRTCAAQKAISALGQKRTDAPQQGKTTPETVFPKNSLQRATISLRT
jgi:hypothetical protein